MRRFLAVVVLLLMVGSGAPANAQGAGPIAVVMPPGSRIGIAPLQGFGESSDFMGFADPTTGSSVTFTELPAEAWAPLRSELTAQSLQQRGIQETARSSFMTKAGEALLIEGMQGVGAAAAGKYMLIFPGAGFTAMVTVNLMPAAVMRHSRPDVHAMLASTTAVPIASMSPRDALIFTFEETPRLKLLQTLGRQGAVLRQVSTPDRGMRPVSAVVSLTRMELTGEDRGVLATRILGRIAQLRDVAVSENAHVAVGPLTGIAQRATARDARDGSLRIR